MATNTLTDSSSIFSKVAKAAAKGAAEGQAKPPKMPKEVTRVEVQIADNGGYIVSYHKPGDDFSSKHVQKVYDDMAGVLECLEDVFGKKKEAKEEKSGEEY